MAEEFVPKYYQMNPETEDVLFDGNALVNGMKVLIEDPEYRTTIPPNGFHGLNQEVLNRARRWNRWLTVSDLRFDKTNRSVSFIGIYYPDGVKMKITALIDLAWLVKKETIKPALSATDIVQHGIRGIDLLKPQ